MDKETYLINQLAERAGVTVRTIRYYVNEGLLPPPQNRGRYSAYDEEYLYRIKLIKFYKEAYLPLSRIRELLEGMTPEQIRETVEKFEQEPPEFNLPTAPEMMSPGEENTSARNYLRKIRGPEAPLEMSSEAMPGWMLEDRVAESSDMIIPSFSIKSYPSEIRADFSWKRIEAAEGIELLVREDVYQQREDEIKKLLARLGRGSRQA